MKKFITTFLVTCVVLLSGCNGSSGENDDNSSLVASKINLTITNSTGTNQHSFDKNEIITLIATVYDENDKQISNRLVNFSASVGVLSPASKLTDSNGQAIVYITNENLEIAAANATASILELSDDVDYEYIDNNEQQIPAVISTELLLNGSPVNQFKADQQVQVSVKLTNINEQVLSNQIITFTADIGTLNTTTALTNENGIAYVILSGNENNVGAGVVTASTTLDNSSVSITNRMNYEVLPKDTTIIDSEVRLGYFDDNNDFIEGSIKLSIADNSISAGGTLGLSVDLVDSTNNLITSPAQVIFTSNCVQSGHANLDNTVFSIRGNAKATFEDIDCAGRAGTDDIIIASITVNGITNTASQTINITGEQLGSIEFISAEPTSIVLKGSGGQETSTLTFKVKSALGNVLAQQAVDFNLNTTVGGISLSRITGLTNSQGLITTQVAAGTVPTAVRVTAKALMNIDNQEITVQTQSDLLSVNTGLPEQRSLTIAASPLNPEADTNGETSEISVWLADNFNNPVPDGTTVNFTTEGGVIVPSCTTTNGQCSVTWTSAQPRVPDHRITILASALGHETFFDTNGNNTFDDIDGNAIIDASVSSGFGRHNAESSGFVDMTEAWRDDNENLIYDNGEVFLDFNNDEAFTAQDILFNGPQCQGNKCAVNNSIHVRKALPLIMSGSSAGYILSSGKNIYEDNLEGISNAIPNIADGTRQALNFYFSDLVKQALPIGTTVSVSTTAGELEGMTSFTMPNTNVSQSIDFSVFNALGGDPDNGVVTITITTPKNIVTQLTTVVNLL